MKICTVLLITYNHAKYIKKAIESVLEQKTKYEYIIHIFDDASTDGTSDIVREYAEKYPDKIIPFIAEQNQGAQTNIWNAYKSVNTKYCALLECDDYWCDENKLELQIDALEEHQECSFCACNTQILNEGDKFRKLEDGNLLVVNNEVRNNKVISKEFLLNIPFGYINHIGSRVVRFDKINLDSIKNKEDFLYDNCQFYYLLLKGNMYFIDKIMHSYIQTGNGTFSSLSIAKRMQIHIKNLIDFNKDTNLELSELVFKDMKNFLNYYSYIQTLAREKENKKLKTKNILDFLVQNCQKLKRYLLPRFVIDILDIPFNLIKFVSKHIKQKGEK